MEPVDWSRVWETTAAGLKRHADAGRGHLLTEDTLRLCLIESLDQHGVAAGRLAAEVITQVLPGAKLDLAVDGPNGTVIELKYPRDSRTGISPDTMTLGELVRDFCRVGLLTARERWVGQVINTRLADYLVRVGAKYQLGWVFEPGETMLLNRAALAALPRTALTAIGERPWRLPIQATCVVRASVTETLTLFAYRVEAPGADTLPQPLVEALEPIAVGQARDVTRPCVEAPKGARAAILAAIDELIASGDRGTVTPREVIAHLKTSGAPFAASTIRTMMSSHMCVGAQGPGVGSYDDLERLRRGEYRRRASQP